MNHFQRAILLFSLAFCLAARAADAPRTIITQAILTEDAAAKRTLITSLAGQGDEVIPELLAAWRSDAIFLYVNEAGTVPVLLTGDKDASGTQAAVRVDDGQPLKDPAGLPLRLVGSDLKTADHTSALRRAMKGRGRRTSVQNGS